MTGTIVIGRLVPARHGDNAGVDTRHNQENKGTQGGGQGRSGEGEVGEEGRGVPGTDHPPPSCLHPSTNKVNNDWKGKRPDYQPTLPPPPPVLPPSPPPQSWRPPPHLYPVSIRPGGSRATGSPVSLVFRPSPQEPGGGGEWQKTRRPVQRTSRG